MLKFFLKCFLVFLSFSLLSIPVYSQPNKNAQNKRYDTLTLDPNQFIKVAQLQKIVAALRSSPVVPPDCEQENCGNFGAYRDAMFNLFEDVQIYESAINESANIYKDQWQIYLNQNYNNERLKVALVTFLGIKDMWTGTATFLLDLVSAKALFDSKKPISAGNLNIFLQVLDSFDNTLSKLNILIKGVNKDANDGLISSVAGDNLDDAWEGLKASLDLVRESLKEYQRLKPQLDALVKSKGVLKTAKDLNLSKLTRQSKGNIAAAIGKLLVVYSNIERNEMRKAIAELDKVLDANQHVQSDYFQLYQLQRQLLDQLAIIKRIANNSMNLINHQAIMCGEGFVTRDRKYVEVGEGRFGDALRYYKGILDNTAATLANSWKDIKPCVQEKGKPYQVVVVNGLGNSYEADILLEERGGTQPVYRGKSSNANPMYLVPERYNIKIAEQNSTKSSVKAAIDYMSYAITGSEPHEFRLNPTGRDSMYIIKLAPYARLYLEVVNQDRNTVDYSYSISKSEDKSLVLSGLASGRIALDLPAATTFDVTVYSSSNSETKTGVAWPNTTAKSLRFEFNDEEGEFLEDSNINSPIDQIDEDGVTKAEKEQEKNKGIPDGWVEGRVYNANNVSCQYAGQSLLFVHHGDQLYNIETGKFTEGVVVQAGKSARVAAPANGAFLRVFLTNGGEVGKRIAFLQFDEFFTGWWFAAGCKNGSKPSTNCDNGNGEKGVGSACMTLGED